MRKLFKALLCICFSACAYAQTTVVSATITDSDGSVWSNATGSVQFSPNPAAPNINSYTLGGVALTSPTYTPYLSQNITTNGSGILSVNLLDNNLITPSGSRWYFVIKSNTSAQATAYIPIAVSGASQSITGYLSTNAIPPRFPAYGGFAYGYADLEVTPVPNAGGFYFNTTNTAQRIWNGSAWSNSAGTGSASFPGTNGFVCNTSTSAATTCTNGQLLTLLGFTPVANTVTVNGHALSSNVVVSATDLTTGTLPHAQLPALVSADIPNNTANTTGSAGSSTTSTTATNIAGGGVGSLPYQSSAGITAFLASPTTNTGHTYTNVWQPIGAALVPIVYDLGVLPTGGTFADTSSAQTFTNKSIDSSEVNSGVLAAARIPAFSGDMSTSAGATVSTLASVNGSSGSCGDATHVCQVTTNAKGLTTGQTAVAISASAASSVYVHTLTTTTPTVVVNSITIPATDVNNYLLAANATSITLPASTAIADGEIIRLLIVQSASGGPWTLPTGTAQSPLTAGSGTTLTNSISGGCPTLGTTQSASVPSELFISLHYQASITQYIIIGCQAVNTAQIGTVEFAITTGLNLWGTYNLNQVLASTSVKNSGHFTNLQVQNSDGGTCTTPPQFNIFDGTTNIGTALAATTSLQTKGLATNQTESLAFNAGDNIGIYISTAGASCTATHFSVTAQVVEP